MSNDVIEAARAYAHAHNLPELLALVEVRDYRINHFAIRTFDLDEAVAGFPEKGRDAVRLTWYRTMVAAVPYMELTKKGRQDRIWLPPA